MAMRSASAARCGSALYFGFPVPEEPADGATGADAVLPPGLLAKDGGCLGTGGFPAAADPGTEAPMRLCDAATGAAVTRPRGTGAPLPDVGAARSSDKRPGTGAAGGAAAPAQAGGPPPGNEAEPALRLLAAAPLALGLTFVDDAGCGASVAVANPLFPLPPPGGPRKTESVTCRLLQSFTSDWICSLRLNHWL